MGHITNPIASCRLDVLESKKLVSLLEKLDLAALNNDEQSQVMSALVQLHIEHGMRVAA
jgi:hypothetical protein